MLNGGKCMTGMVEQSGAKVWNVWRIARWTVAGLLLLTPAVMMQVNDEWNWNIGSFLFAGVMIGGAGLLYELAERFSGNWAYRAGVAVALISAFLLVWSTIVRDDGTGEGFFLVIMAVVVGGFACRFLADGMARTMLGVAIMQALFGIAIATAPSTADTHLGPSGFLLYNGFFAVLWLTSAGLFRRARQAE
jgi:hypothetical protein